MKKQQRTQEENSGQQGGSLQALLTQSVDHRLTRRILEIRFPILLYILIDQHNRCRLIGRPGLPGGHFQLGAFDASRKGWTPAAHQDGLVWESKHERDCILHRIHRRHNPDLEIALIQHAPTYTTVHDVQVLESIDEVLVTPLWDTKMAYQTYTCNLLVQCGCSVYQQLLETRNFHWM